jgi:hypothetical protein
VSVGGNIAHTWHPAPAVLAQAGETAETWRPALGAQVFAAVWPLALLVTVEVLARVDWPRTFGWSAARYGGASLVAGVAAVMSYAHLNGLLRAYGEGDVTARIGPLSVDGLMVVCGFALLAIGQPSERYESRDEIRDEMAASSDGGSQPLPWWPLPELDPAPDVHSPVDGYALWDDIEPEPAEVPVPGEPDPVLARAAEVFAGDLSQGRTPGIRRIKKALRVGQDRAREVQEQLTVLASQ